MNSPYPVSPEQMQEWLAGYVSGPLDAGLLVRLQAYLSLLLRWNQRMNLTAVRDPEAIVRRHFGESLFLVEHLPPVAVTEQTLLDHGSGAGFPGLPIALARPEIQVTLSESQSRKAAFLREAVRETAAANVSLHEGRTETLDRQFCWVTARAVDAPSTALSTGWDRVRSGGFLITTDVKALALQATHTEWVTPTSRFFAIGLKA